MAIISANNMSHVLLRKHALLRSDAQDQRVRLREEDLRLYVKVKGRRPTNDLCTSCKPVFLKTGFKHLRLARSVHPAVLPGRHQDRTEASVKT